MRETAAGGPSADEQEPDIVPPDQFQPGVVPDYRYSVRYSVTIAGEYRLRIALVDNSLEVIIQDDTLFEIVYVG